MSVPLPLRPGILIPHFEHERRIGAVIGALEPFGLPLLIVDDGSREPSRALLRELVARREGIELIEHPRNLGKGAAVLTGLRRAAQRGLTHAVQIDADGQHEAADVATFLAAVRECPEALVSGRPIYDASVPRARLHGRKISTFWARVNTWSRDILDPLCGFRVYPVAATLAISERARMGARMQFDTEIMVRAHWEGIPLRFVPTRVTYPPDGVSHFRMLRDNVAISAMHTRLFFGMLARIPTLLRRRSGRVHEVRA